MSFSSQSSGQGDASTRNLQPPVLLLKTEKNLHKELQNIIFQKRKTKSVQSGCKNHAKFTYFSIFKIVDLFCMISNLF